MLTSFSLLLLPFGLFCIIVKCADLEGLPHFQSKIYFHYGVLGIMCVFSLNNEVIGPTIV